MERSGNSSWVTNGDVVVAIEDATEVVDHADSSSVDHDDSRYGDTETSCSSATEGTGVRGRLVRSTGEVRVAEEPRRVCLRAGAEAGDRRDS